MTIRLALPRWTKADKNTSTGCSYDKRLVDHSVRSELVCPGDKPCTLMEGQRARHTLHVTCNDKVFATEIKGQAHCLGLGMAYAEGCNFHTIRTATKDGELLVFDKDVHATGEYPPDSHTESEQVQVKVSSRELGRDGQWETVVAFVLTLQVAPKATAI